MCGIAVALGAVPDEGRRGRALESMRHRGPDGSGTYEDEGLWIGHTRLAIIDLTDAANQPMVSPDGRYVLAYNGEIYNYLELREQIGRDGWPWRGEGDTEVLLALLAQKGADCLRELRGMFAFVLWDRKRRSLLAARDPFGIKPLYYSHEPARTLIASELRTMCALDAFDRLDPLAVESFLLTGSVQGPLTILDRVRSLPPGHLLEVDGGEAAERAYWTLPENVSDARSEPELVEELDDLLRESVRIELRSDVPLGVFLSGGLDSSLVTAYAADAVGDVRTFSVGFEAAGVDWDETSDAQLVADHLGTRHERVIVTSADFAARMAELPRAIDQPSVDGINSHFVAGAAAPNVRVALSGQGGDELFAGYNVFRVAARLRGAIERGASLPAPARRLARKTALLPARIQHNWYLRGMAGVLTGGDVELLTANPLFGPSEVGARRSDSPSPPNGDLVNSMSIHLIRTYLANTLLRDMDAMSMSHSLEVRVPLVDRMLAEFALAIPGTSKVSWENPKALFRALARRRLPHELLHRPKHGFNFPLAEWLAQPDCYRRVSEALSPDAVAEAGLVEPRVVSRELARLRQSWLLDVPWLRAQRVWALYVLHEWHRNWRADRLASC